MNTLSLKKAILISPFSFATGRTKGILRLLSWWLLLPAAWIGQTVQSQAQCGSNITVTVTLTAEQLNGTYTVTLGGSGAGLSGSDPCNESVWAPKSNTFSVVLQPNVNYALVETWSKQCGLPGMSFSNSCSCFSLFMGNTVQWGDDEHGGRSTDVSLTGSNRVLFSTSPIPADGESTTTAYVEFPELLGGCCSNISWQIVPPGLGCSILSIAPDGFSCVIRSGTNEGTITVVARGTNDCPAAGTLELKKCDSCSSGTCTAGSTSAGLGNGAEYNIALGAERTQNGEFRSAGELQIQATTPSASMYTPASLFYNSPDKGVVITNVQGQIVQVKTAETISIVTVISSIEYTITVYSVSSIVGFTNGLFVIAQGATPITTITVENPDSSGSTTNSLRITEDRGGNVTVADYTYANGAWQLTTGGGLRLDLQTVTASSGIRTVVDTVKSGSTTNRVTTRRYQSFPWGESLIEVVEGVGDASRTNTYTYNSNGLLRQITLPDGGWEIYVYDDFARPTNIFSAWLNQAPTTNSSLCRLIQHDYSSAVVPNSGNDTNTRPYAPRRTIEKVLDTEVSRRFQIHYFGTSKDIRCPVSGSAWDASTNLVTITRFYTNRFDTNGHFYGLAKRVIRPDWTVELYSYETNQTNFITVFQSGRPADDFWVETGEDKDLWFGTVSTNVVTRVGRPVSRTVLNFFSPWDDGMPVLFFTNSAVTYSDPDSVGRPRRIDYSDGTWTYTDFGCCGQTVFTNREGTVTTYGYDALERLVTTTVAGITTSNTFDAAGAVIATVRHGTDSTAITLSTAAYDTAGQLVSTGDGVGNPTAYTNYFDASGFRVRKTTLPGSGTSIEKDYRDGQPSAVEGTAVFPVTFLHGVTNDGLGRRFTIEQRGTATEWVLTVRDMLGRHHKTLFASPSTPHPSTQSFYDTAGALAKSVDPDGNITLRTPDSFYWWLIATFNFHSTVSEVTADLNRNSQMDLAGTDRIVQTVSDFLENGTLSGWAERTQAFERATDGADSPLLTSTTERTFDGLHSVTVRFGLTNRTDTFIAGGGFRYVTNTLPDGTYSLESFKDGRLLSSQTLNPQLGTLNHVTYGYDPHGRQNKMTNVANGTVITYQFDGADRMTNATVAASGLPSQSTAYSYDAPGRVWRTILPDGASVTNEFFTNGLLKKTYGARTYPVAYGYDSQGRMTNMTTWQSFAAGSGSAVTRWKYDAHRGFMTNKVYADGKGPFYGYTNSGRLVKRTWARGTNTTYSYNDAGDLLTATYSDPGSPSITNTYDRRGRATTIKQGTNNTTRVYDDAGNLLSENNTVGILVGLAVSNRYDSLLRRTTNGVWNGSAWLTQTRYAYDAASRLFTVSDGTNTAAYTYLTNSPLVTTIQFTNAGSLRMTTRKEYDGLYRLTGISSSNGVAGVLSSHAYQYNSANQRSRATHEDSAYWVYEYDTLGQVKSGKKYWSDGTPVAGQQFEYGFDDIGNRKTAASGGDHWGANLRYENYTANNLNQYSQRTVPGSMDVLGAANSNATATLWTSEGLAGSVSRKGEYFRGEVRTNNAAGPVWLAVTNIGVLQDGSNPDIVTTNTGNALLPPAAETYLHDLDGNLIRNGLWTNLWNAESRWITAQSLTTIPSAARKKVDFAYDYQGRRVQKIVSTWNGSAYVPQSTNRFLYDGWNLLAIINSASAVSQSFVWGLDLSGTEQSAGGVGGLLAVNAGSNGAHFVAFDDNANVSALVSVTNGTNTATYDYSPFGQVLRASGPMALANGFRFCTRLHDDEIGTVYYGYRDYEPAIGRWLSRDPLGDFQFHDSSFRFCANVPVSQIDVLGLIAWTRILEWLGPAIGPLIGNWIPADPTRIREVSDVICPKGCSRKLIYKEEKKITRSATIVVVVGGNSKTIKTHANALLYEFTIETYACCCRQGLFTSDTTPWTVTHSSKSEIVNLEQSLQIPGQNALLKLDGTDRTDITTSSRSCVKFCSPTSFFILGYVNGKLEDEIWNSPPKYE